MERKRIICLFLFVVFILVFASCHPRHVSDIKPNMTKEEVISLWGKTDLITHRPVNGKTTETWEYHFSNTNSICSVTFSQDRVVATQCRPLRGRRYWYYSQSEQNRPAPPPIEQSLVREGSFSMRLAEVLKIGLVKSEAEAESRLASMGIAPKNGWIADYPMTPTIIGQVRNAVVAAAALNKLPMGKDEALRTFEGLTAEFGIAIGPAPGQYAETPPIDKVPIITHAFAVDKGKYGYIWKIYLEAEEPDGEMLRIASVVDQPGYGHYPTNWIYLKPEYQKHFKGYIQWNTFSSKAPYLKEWTQITLKVSIIDKAGNESNEVVFPFTFQSGVKDQYRYKLPAPFNEGNIPQLGSIFIDLYEPLLMPHGGGTTPMK